MNEKELKTIIIIMIIILFSSYISIAVWCIKTSKEAREEQYELEKREITLKNRKVEVFNKQSK